MARGKAGWKKTVGRDVVENKMLMASLMARYQETKKANDGDLAKLLGVPQTELARVGGAVIPENQGRWAVDQGLSVEGVLKVCTMLAERSPQKKEPLRMASIRLPESDHVLVKRIADEWSLSVTAVYHKAIQELASKALNRL